MELDTRKFRVAKQVRDAEEESERLEGELESLRTELERVEGEGVEGSEAAKRARGMDDPTMWVLHGYDLRALARGLTLGVFANVLTADCDYGSTGPWVSRWSRTRQATTTKQRSATRRRVMCMW